MEPGTSVDNPAMPARVIALVLLIGATVGLLTTPRIVADGSNYLGMAMSLVADNDLRWTPDDLARVRGLNLDAATTGLLLLKRANGYVFAKPMTYPLLAAPFVALAGAHGFMLLNGLLLAGLVLLGADVLSHRLAWPTALGVATVVIGASVTPVYLHWIDPFLLMSLLTAAAIAACRRERPVLAGALLGAMAATRFPYAALLLGPALLYVAGRRWRHLALLAAAALVVCAGALLLTRAATGQWSPYTGERYYYADAVPYEIPRAGEVGTRYTREDLVSNVWHPPSLADLARGAGQLLVGRFAGVLLYTPALVACLLWMRRLDREKAAWMLALAVYCLITLLIIPHRRIGGTYALGSRLFVLLPVALVMVDFVAWRWGRILATLALLALALPVVQAPVYLSLNPGRQTLVAPYKWFPVEWLSALELPYPVELDGMHGLTDQQYWREEGGTWTRGGGRAQFVLIRPAGAPAAVEVWSLLPSARIGEGNELRETAFEPFVRQTVSLSHPVAVIRDEYQDFAEFAVYLFTVETSSGVRAFEVLPNSTDRRSLGVFVRALP